MINSEEKINPSTFHKEKEKLWKKRTFIQEFNQIIVIMFYLTVYMSVTLSSSFIRCYFFVESFFYKYILIYWRHKHNGMFFFYEP